MGQIKQTLVKYDILAHPWFLEWEGEEAQSAKNNQLGVVYTELVDKLLTYLRPMNSLQECLYSALQLDLQ